MRKGAGVEDSPVCCSRIYSLSDGSKRERMSMLDHAGSRFGQDEI